MSHVCRRCRLPRGRFWPRRAGARSVRCAKRGPHHVLFVHWAATAAPLRRGWVAPVPATRNIHMATRLLAHPSAACRFLVACGFSYGVPYRSAGSKRTPGPGPGPGPLGVRAALFCSGPYGMQCGVANVRIPVMQSYRLRYYQPVPVASVGTSPVSPRHCSYSIGPRKGV